jgi:hypothetical protein
MKNKMNTLQELSFCAKYWLRKCALYQIDRGILSSYGNDTE